ncbi:MAG TPA: polyphosphate:AMP phosphotransferase [Terriglobia bacterium]|nr:polyphosphate:AMP phosphotransferase [Terriglobia bacterium]
MFESAELGHKVSKTTYDREAPKLREALLDAQFELAQSKTFPVVILIGGVDGAGKGETVNTLNAWMDPRHIRTNAMGDPSDEERERPPMWRFWRALPPKGTIGIFFGSWYTAPIISRVSGHAKNADLEKSIQEIRRFEKMLADEGALILKFWFHLSKKQQRIRLKSLEKDPKTRWRVTETDWERFKLYDKFRCVSEQTLRHTTTEYAPWLVVEGSDERYRTITVGKAILDALNKRLHAKAPKAQVIQPAPLPAVDNLHLLNTLDLTLKLSKDNYKRELEKYEGRLNLLTRDPKFKGRSVVALFEGNDAAGKGGAVRRITGALDARIYHIVPVAAPTDEERAQPYLWRFWRQLPRLGTVTIFDRSWYGRVLVERVQGFCSQTDWLRAYSEINDFEEEMTRHGILLVKFWLAISQQEQLRRFKERQATGFKRFKLTSEDWRNRKKWNDYVRAVCDMVDQTSSEIAPWTLVEANDKYYARIKVLRTICDRIEGGL